MSNSGSTEQSNQMNLYVLKQRTHALIEAIKSELQRAGTLERRRSWIIEREDAFDRIGVNRDLAARFATLREDVKKSVHDPDFDRVVPGVWILIPWHVFLILILGLVLFVLLEAILLSVGVSKSIGTTIFLGLFVLLFGGIGLFLAFSIFFGERRILASSIKLVWDRAIMLQQYLDHLDLDFQYLESSNAFLSQELSFCEDRLAEAEHEINNLRQLLVGQETQNQLDLGDDVLNKLTRLERTRLVEALVAYNNNAWTPAEAVCGMILEGRLQVMCRENDLPIRGLNGMIKELGQAGLLERQYEPLTRIGEFFRHRSVHPTSEEFDRSKTTLIILTLVILIREVF